MMQSGELDRLIEFYVPSDVKSPTGQIKKTWTLFDSDWANRKDLLTQKDSERVQNNTQKVAFGISQYTIRFREDINATMRIKDDGVWFEIVGQPLIVGRRHFSVLNAEQRDNIQF